MRSVLLVFRLLSLLFFIHSPHSNSLASLKMLPSPRMRGFCWANPISIPTLSPSPPPKFRVIKRRTSGAIRVIFARIQCHQKLSGKVQQTASLLWLLLPHDMSPTRERSAQSSFTSVFSGDYSNFASLTKSHFNPAN